MKNIMNRLPVDVCGRKQVRRFSLAIGTGYEVIHYSGSITLHAFSSTPLVMYLMSKRIGLIMDVAAPLDK